MDNCNRMYYKDKLKESKFGLIVLFILNDKTYSDSSIFLTQRAHCKILSLLLWSNLNFYFVYLNIQLTQYHISLHSTGWKGRAVAGDLLKTWNECSRQEKLFVIDHHISALVLSLAGYISISVKQKLYYSSLLAIQHKYFWLNKEPQCPLHSSSCRNYFTDSWTASKWRELNSPEERAVFSRADQ